MTLAEADQVFARQQYAEALELYRQAEGTVEAWSQIARCCSLTSRMDEGRKWLEKARLGASSEEPLGWSRYLGVRGIFERESGDKVKAKATFVEMYEYCVAKNLPKRAVDAVHHVAIVVPPEEQAGWALKGIAEAEKLKDDGWLAVLWNNLGATYEDLKQFEKAVGAYTTAREFHHRGKDDQRKLAADWAVAHATRLAGRPGDAREPLEKALAWAEKLKSAEWIGWCRKDLGECLVALGEKAQGLALLKEARASLVEAGIETWWAEGLKQVDQAIEGARK